MTDPAPVHPIEARSYAIIAGRVDLSGWQPGDRQVVARVIHATADESFADSMRIGERAVASATAAMRQGRPIVCDAKMVAAGMPSPARRCPVHCYLDQVSSAPPGGTRSAAAMDLAAAEHPEGAVWVIGNAPTALERLIRLHEAGLLRPEAVIGLPVGYVGASEAKAALWESPLRAVSITNLGERGGSPAAAAAANAIARLISPPGPGFLEPE
jgi:precorrin-8X/cobalt-precorrin-8 methylmutase